MVAFHHTVVRMEDRDLTVLYLQDQPLVQQPQLDVQTVGYLPTAAQMVAKDQTVSFQDHRQPLVQHDLQLTTNIYLLVPMEDTVPTVSYHPNHQ